MHSFDHKHDGVNVMRNFLQPLVIGISVINRRRQQLDYAAQRSRLVRSLRVGFQTVIRAELLPPGFQTIGKVAIEDLLNQIQIIFGIGHKDRTVQKMASAMDLLISLFPPPLTV